MTPADPRGGPTRSDLGGAVGAPPPGSPAGHVPPTAGTGYDTAPGTGGNGNGPGVPDGPFAPPPPKPWYLRSTALAAAAVLIIALIAVVVDFPTHATKQEHVATMTTEINAINKDVHPCSYAVQQAFQLYRADFLGNLTANESAHMTRYLRDDQAACSFTNQSVIDLGTLTLPQTAGGQHLSAVIKSVLEWETSDGVAAIDDIETLVAHPHAATPAADLRKRERLLASDRADARRATAAVNKALGGTNVPPPALPALPTNLPPA